MELLKSKKSWTSTSRLNILEGKVTLEDSRMQLRHSGWQILLKWSEDDVKAWIEVETEGDDFPVVFKDELEEIYIIQLIFGGFSGKRKKK